MDKIWDNYVEVKRELEDIVALMKKETKCNNKFIIFTQKKEHRSFPCV